MEVFTTIETQKPAAIRPASTRITWSDTVDHIKARLGWNRSGHRVAPGLYSIGNPVPASPVFVTANYTLSFDALRKALAGMDGYILVLDTKGVNVWCAAGKGTLGTDELVNRIASVDLKGIVEHRHVILPQLGAVGVAAHLAKKRSGFKVEYGPVRAEDLPEYMKTRKAAPEMRKVRFGLWDRAVLIPVELTNYFMPMALSTLALLLIGGWMPGMAVFSAFFSGLFLFPLLLPWLPSANFSLKGFALGAVTAAPFIYQSLAGQGETVDRHGWAGFYALAMPPVTAYLALNFTGSTPFTSLSGVKKEIAAYTPVMAAMAGLGLLAVAGMFLVKWIS
ncbi:MAG: carbon monoxide dehydrogenase [Nitrospinae bacterium]|nr:carbon monoxide dehydrogenase [Nitrospinota bacterium]